RNIPAVHSSTLNLSVIKFSVYPESNSSQLNMPPDSPAIQILSLCASAPLRDIQPRRIRPRKAPARTNRTKSSEFCHSHPFQIPRFLDPHDKPRRQNSLISPHESIFEKS